MAEALDITGQRFGQLTVLHVGTRKSRLGRWWLCVCDCGKFTERATAYLRYYKKSVSCETCARARSAAGCSRGMRRWHYTQLFLNTGRLWSVKSNERLARNIARALENEGHQALPYDEISLPVAGYSLLDAIETLRAIEMPATVAERIKRANDHRVRVRRRSEELYRIRHERELAAYAERERTFEDRYRARL